MGLVNPVSQQVAWVTPPFLLSFLATGADRRAPIVTLVAMAISFVIWGTIYYICKQNDSRNYRVILEEAYYRWGNGNHKKIGNSDYLFISSNYSVCWGWYTRINREISFRKNLSNNSNREELKDKVYVYRTKIDKNNI